MSCMSPIKRSKNCQYCHGLLMCCVLFVFIFTFSSNFCRNILLMQKQRSVERLNKQRYEKGRVSKPLVGKQFYISCLSMHYYKSYLISPKSAGSGINGLSILFGLINFSVFQKRTPELNCSFYLDNWDLSTRSYQFSVYRVRCHVGRLMFS